jgi:hypothetical protein
VLRGDVQPDHGDLRAKLADLPAFADFANLDPKAYRVRFYDLRRAAQRTLTAIDDKRKAAGYLGGGTHNVLKDAISYRVRTGPFAGTHIGIPNQHKLLAAHDVYLSTRRAQTRAAFRAALAEIDDPLTRTQHWNTADDWIQQVYPGLEDLIGAERYDLVVARVARVVTADAQARALREAGSSLPVANVDPNQVVRDALRAFAIVVPEPNQPG